MPKGTDLSVHSVEDLDAIAKSLNNRPRKTLDYLKPSEKLAELLATTLEANSPMSRDITIVAGEVPEFMT
jgi:hypothetical protein